MTHLLFFLHLLLRITLHRRSRHPSEQEQHSHSKIYKHCNPHVNSHCNTHDEHSPQSPSFDSIHYTYKCSTFLIPSLPSPYTSQLPNFSTTQQYLHHSLSSIHQRFPNTQTLLPPPWLTSPQLHPRFHRTTPCLPPRLLRQRRRL